MKQLLLILLFLSTYNTALFSMDSRPLEQPCVALAIVSVKRSFESPKIHEQPARLLDNQVVEIATNHAPEKVKEMIRSLQSPATITKPLLSVLAGPGVGKTTLAQAVAQKAQVNCKIIHAACMGTSYLFSEQEHLLQAIAPLIETDDPWVVVLDDIDCLRHYTKVFDLRIADPNEQGVGYHPDDEVVTYDPIESLDYYYGKQAYHVVSPARVLCDLLDILEAKKRNNIAFIGTSREPQKIPEFVKKRFEIVDIPLPNESLRRSVLEYRLAGIPTEKFKGTNSTAVANYFASRTEGLCQFRLNSLSDSLIEESYTGVINNETIFKVLAEASQRWGLELNKGLYDKVTSFLKANKVLTASIGLNAALLLYWLGSHRARR